MAAERVSWRVERTHLSREDGTDVNLDSCYDRWLAQLDAIVREVEGSPGGDLPPDVMNALLAVEDAQSHLARAKLGRRDVSGQEVMAVISAAIASLAAPRWWHRLTKRRAA